MRDFTLPWGLSLGLVKCFCFELPTASGPKSARVYCGYRPGPTRVALHPGKMVEVPERQLLRAWFAWVWKWLHCCVQWWTFCGVALSDFPHPSSTDAARERCRAYSGQCLHPSART